VRVTLYSFHFSRILTDILDPKYRPEKPEGFIPQDGVQIPPLARQQVKVLQVKYTKG
jgi:hypothetical protein